MGNEGAALVYIGYALICAFIASYMAHRKRRSMGLWFILGGLLGIIGLIILSLLDSAGVEWAPKKPKK